MKYQIHRRILVNSIRFILICAVLCFSYVLYNYHDFNSRVAKARFPLPAKNQVNDVFFNSIAEHSGLQQAIVKIVKDGKYSLPGENFTFDHQVRPTSFVTIDKVMKLAQRRSKRRTSKQWDGYLKVYKFSEELTKQMLVFMALAVFPGFENMKIVAPNFKNGRLGSMGHTQFEDLFNLKQLNQIFANNDYPPIVSNEEYNDACKKSKPIYGIDFIPPKGNSRYIGYTDSIRDQLYNKDKTKGWIDCDVNVMLRVSQFVNVTERKLLCTTWRFNISTLRQTVLKNVKCIEVLLWHDHGGYGGSVRPDRLSPGEIFQYLLNPSDMIINEAKTFTEQFLERPYVAIHIRANHINNLPTTVDRCYRVAMRIVAALREKRGVKSVYLSTDMTEFGCQGSFEPGHEEYLARISGAVRYNPNATGKLKEISRTSVALTNVLLLKKSDHLIAMGAGSFHGYVMNQFLKEHFEKDPKMWSMIRMCENARGMYRKPTGTYPKT